MDNQLGSLLRSCRLERQMSMRALAAAAGVGVATVSRWEAGAFLPRMVELEAVLKALGITGARREEALMHVHAPRAIKRLQRTPDAVWRGYEIGPMLSNGDLLRAMRHRRGWQRGQVADAMGVSLGTVRRWEQGQAAPPFERMERLLDAMGAFPQERAVLADGVSFLLPPLGERMASVEMLRDACRPTLWPHYESEPALRNDLAYLSFAAQAWRFAAESPEGRRLLAEIYANYASFLVWRHRHEEALEYANRSLELTGNEETLSTYALRAAFVSCRARYHGPQHLAPDKVVVILQRWLAKARAVPGHHILATWTLGQTGEYLSYAGRMDQALAAHEQACAIASRAEDEAERRDRDNARAALLLRMGRPSAALAVLDAGSDATPGTRAELAVCRAECFHALGSVSDAQDNLATALPAIRTYDLAHLELRAAKLSRLL